MVMGSDMQRRSPPCPLSRIYFCYQVVEIPRQPHKKHIVLVQDGLLICNSHDCLGPIIRIVPVYSSKMQYGCT